MNLVKEAIDLGFSNAAVMDTKNWFLCRNIESFVKKTGAAVII